MGRGEIRREGAGEKGNESALFSPFSRRFSTGGAFVEERATKLGMRQWYVILFNVVISKCIIWFIDTWYNSP